MMTIEELREGVSELVLPVEETDFRRIEEGLQHALDELERLRTENEALASGNHALPAQCPSWYDGCHCGGHMHEENGRLQETVRAVNERCHEMVEGARDRLKDIRDINTPAWGMEVGQLDTAREILELLEAEPAEPTCTGCGIPWERCRLTWPQQRKCCPDCSCGHP